MSVQRYIRKPVKPEEREEQFAAKYTPGQPIDDLLTVAKMAGSEAEVIEVTFPSGRRVLFAWYLDIPEEHPAEPDYVIVEPGDYLAYSRGHWHLYSCREGNWTQFYDLAPEE